MSPAQGFVARKLLGDMGEAMSMAFASAPSPLSSPCDNTSHINPPQPNSVIVALTVILFLATLLSAHLQRCYLRYNPGRATRMPYYRPPLSPPPHGLDSAILETLPKVVFSSTMDKKTQTECMICLEEFENEQTLQVLPQCRHGFHPECIRMWLFSHTTCPLCRHSLLIPFKPSASSSSTEVAAYDSTSVGGVTLTDQQPSTPSPVQNSEAASISIILVEKEAVATNPNGGESKPSQPRTKPRRSNSTGHFPTREESATYSSSPLPLRSFIITSDFHRCRSHSMIVSKKTFTS